MRTRAMNAAERPAKVGALTSLKYFAHFCKKVKRKIILMDKHAGTRLAQPCESTTAKAGCADKLVAHTSLISGEFH